jgi:F-type H+-transporting ATPase subunit alpha
MRQFSGRVRLEYAQFLELEMFTRFGGMSDTRVKGQLARGQAIRALLEQPRFTPLRAIDQIALLAALKTALSCRVGAGLARLAQQGRRTDRCRRP